MYISAMFLHSICANILLMNIIQNLVENELIAVRQELSSLHLETDEVCTSLREFITGPSKRIRSLVTLLFLKAHIQQISKNSISIIATGEIIHNASLLHDDVIDNAKMRRGNITLWNKYSPSIAILSGDYLLSLATEKLLDLNNIEVSKLFLNCIKQMCNAEIHHFILRGKIPKIEEYIKICENKTAKLFEAILVGCSMVENLDLDFTSNFAKDFGIYFQLINDMAKESSGNDSENKIYTAKDILGIEKNTILMDNYQRRLIKMVHSLPNNIYKKGLEALVVSLCLTERN